MFAVRCVFIVLVNYVTVFVNDLYFDYREFFNKQYDLAVGRIPFAVYIQQLRDSVIPVFQLILIMVISLRAIKIIYVEYCVISKSHYALIHYISGECVTVNNTSCFVRVINGRRYIEYHITLIRNILAVFFCDIDDCLVCSCKYISEFCKILLVIFDYVFTKRCKLFLIG